MQTIVFPPVFCELLRIWTVGIADGKNKELEAFANNVSAPMFKNAHGCMGVLFAQAGDECKTITIWDNPESVAALNDSPAYKTVVAAIEDSGILSGEHHTEVLELYGGFATTQLSDSLPGVRIFG